VPIADVVTAVKDYRRRAPQVSLYRDYDQGRHRYPFATEAFKKDYLWILQNARENMCPAVIRSFTDLVTVQAWSGDGADAANELAATLPLRRVVNLTVREAHRTGDGYVLVWPDSKGVVRPWYHRADQVAYKLTADDPDEFEWVAKLWVVDSGVEVGKGRVNLYYADRVERFITQGKVQHDDTSAADWPEGETSYLTFAGDDGGDTITHQFGKVPWAHLAFDADAQGGHGRSVLRDVVPLQDGLNKSVADLIVGSESFARPLRALMNYNPDVRIDPQTGMPVQERLDFDPTKQSILGVRGPGPLTQLDPPDATRLTAVQEAFASKIARVVGIPITDVLPDIGNVPSGAALRVLSARRTNAVRDFEQDNAASLVRMMSLLGVEDAFPEWADPAPVDGTERLDIAQAKADLGYPLAEVLPDLGEDPDDIRRILAARDAENANAGAAAVRAFRQGQDPARALEE
jgi:hypothetical protein